ncbi:transcription factor bHLH128-like [Typha latifolia]|uniref:transcription factor bHLH128-like n=1 Tax=Typha latifolia TaxID=4733 RepID=UPI003C2B8573
MNQSHRPAAAGALGRNGSAPGSFLTSLSDSVIGAELHPAAGTEWLAGRFFSCQSPPVTAESSCKASGTAATLAHQRSYGSGEISIGDQTAAENSKGGGGSPLVRHSSLPAGFFSHPMVDNGFSVTRDGGSYSRQGPDGVHPMANNRRLKSQLSFSRQSTLSQISEIGIPDMGESVGGNHHSDISGGFSIGSWDDSNSIIFSPPSSKRAKDNADIIASLSNLESQFSLPKTSLEMASVENFLQIQQDQVPFKIRAKRGCATHPRSIAERERRTRISEKLRKLQELVPNMDKQTNTSDMLDFAVQHIKGLQSQLQILNQEQDNCTCSRKRDKN